MTDDTSYEGRVSDPTAEPLVEDDLTGWEIEPDQVISPSPEPTGPDTDMAHDQNGGDVSPAPGAVEGDTDSSGAQPSAAGQSRAAAAASPASHQRSGGTPTTADTGDDLDENDWVIAHALAKGATHAEAAQAAGVSAKTVQRRTATNRSLTPSAACAASVSSRSRPSSSTPPTRP